MERIRMDGRTAKAAVKTAAVVMALLAAGTRVQAQGQAQEAGAAPPGPESPSAGDPNATGEDEDLLFADTAMVADSAGYVGNAAAIETAADRKTLGISGNILSAAALAANRNYFDGPDVEHTSLSAGVVGDVSLDARLQRGFRAFADLEWSVDPTLSGVGAGAAVGATGADSSTGFRVPEAFLDANLSRKVYFRAGKQVLQWGRGYFFNPTDLINVERRTFFRRIGNREGTYGLRVHAPFGTSANLYGFVDAQGVRRPDSLAAAAKAEFLLGRTEFAVMVWDKGGQDPVYGADASTRFLGLNVIAEAALFQKFRALDLSFIGGIPTVEARSVEWAPRASLSLGRSFDVNGIQDRLTTVAEYYYNRPGSTARRMPFAGLARPDRLPAGTGGLSPDAFFSALATMGFYEPNSYSRQYAAFFATFNRFLRSDISLIFNAIGNLNQRCAQLSAGISYRDINDFGLSFYVNGFAGPEDTEYTFAGQGVQAQLLAEVAF